MSLESILITIFTYGVLSGFFFGVLTLIGASLYDIKEIRSFKRTKRQKPRTWRPLISVIIPVFNEAAVIERCLDDLRRSRYRKIEIIVSDDCSTDTTRKIVREYIKNNPKRKIILTYRRHNAGRGAAINQGIKKASGEIIVAYDADCIIEKDTFKNLVNRFRDERVSAVAANIRILDAGTSLSLLQQFEYLVSFRGKKFNTISNSEFIIGGAGAAYRSSVLKASGGFDDRMRTEDIELSLRLAKTGNKNYGLVYASDYVIHTEPVPTYKGLFRQRFRWKFGSLQALWHNRNIFFAHGRQHNLFLTCIKLPFAIWCEVMLLLEPVFFGYFLYLAVSNQNATLFVSSALALTVIISLAIWSDEHYSLKTRLKMTAYAPLMYLLFNIMTLVQVVAAFRCIGQLKNITSVKGVSGAYTSTQRAAGKLGIVS